ncbi:MAG TPA: hypothetical protein VM369_11675 [Candidatus Binatia bacterium]|nr:hypothetical protein [Candidatus Binatia bacterium]
MLKNAFALALPFALAACGGSLADSKATTDNAPHVIVADIDTTINPYHEFLYAGSEIYKDHAPDAVTPEVLAALGVRDSNVIEVTRTGNLVKDKKTDAALWSRIRRGKPYWIKGTNVVAVSFCDGYPMLEPDTGKNPHGVGTSAAVLTANPDAVILFVEFCDSIGAADAEKYAFSHPAVDILTTSYGPAVPVAGTPPLPLPEGDDLSYDAVVQMGKLHFNSAGNGPGFTPLVGRAGQWWSIGITGSEEYSSDGVQLLSANYADFVSDYTETLPYCMDCEKGLDDGVAGTSFSTPRSAGVASKVILEARRALNHQGGIVIADGAALMVSAGGRTISNWQVRRALEEAAFTGYGVADYDPVAGAGDLVGLPFNDVAPWLQMGWGDLTADTAKGVVAEALAQLGFGTPTRTKDAGFCEYQAMNMRVRQNFFDAYATGGTNVVPDPNPYIFCDTALPTEPAV